MVSVCWELPGRRSCPPVFRNGQHEFPFEFVGLVGFADPVRPQVADAVREAFAAGIRVIMITGDYPLTAQNIARQIGLADSARYITGPELDAIDDNELTETDPVSERICPCRSRTETQDCECPEGNWRSCCNDRRWCERRAGTEIC